VGFYSILISGAGFTAPDFLLYTRIRTGAGALTVIRNRLSQRYFQPLQEGGVQEVASEEGFRGRSKNRKEKKECQ